MRVFVRLLVAVIGIVVMAVATSAPVEAGMSYGSRSDGYCAWDYGQGVNSGGYPESWTIEQYGCLVDADVTSYYQGSTPRTNYCSYHSWMRVCTAPHNSAISQVNLRSAGRDYVYYSWQYKYGYQG